MIVSKTGRWVQETLGTDATLIWIYENNSWTGFPIGGITEKNIEEYKPRLRGFTNHIRSTYLEEWEKRKSGQLKGAMRTGIRFVKDVETERDPNYRTAQLYKEIIHHKMRDEMKLRSFAVGPLGFGDEFYGVLYAKFWGKPHEFTKEEEILFRLFLSCSSHAIYTAKMIEKSKTGADMASVVEDVLKNKLDELLPPALQKLSR